MEYKIQPGDSLQKIARANHTTVEKLLQDNPQMVTQGAFVGDKIHVSVNSAPPADQGVMAYPLAAGDTLKSIADKVLHDPNRWGDIKNANQSVIAELGP